MARCQFDSRRTELTDNLVSLYNQEATGADRAMGNDWYPEARGIVASWANTYHKPVACVASVIAAISPQCEWQRNLIIADDILAGRPAASIGGALYANIRKACAIRDQNAETTLGHLPYGPKVYNFSRNLAGDMQAVTVDTHATQAALGDVLATVNLRWTPYNTFADCYREAAKEVYTAPCDFQAIIWHTWKRLHPRMAKNKARNQWPSDDTID
jgi:hypothetical protein